MLPVEVFLFSNVDVLISARQKRNTSIVGEWSIKQRQFGIPQPSQEGWKNMSGCSQCVISHVIASVLHCALLWVSWGLVRQEAGSWQSLHFYLCLHLFFSFLFFQWRRCFFHIKFQPHLVGFGSHPLIFSSSAPFGILPLLPQVDNSHPQMYSIPHL